MEPMTTPEGDDGVEGFVRSAEQFWQSRGSRLSVVRRVLCEVIAERDEPFDAETLLGWAHKVDPVISISSVYRTVRDLEEAGLLVRIDGSEGERLHCRTSRKKLASSVIVCRDCGSVIPLDDPCLGLRETSSIVSRGFQPEHITLRVEATCSEFARTGACSHRSDRGEA